MMPSGVVTSTWRSIMASPYAGSLRALPVDAPTTGPMLALRRRTADAHRALEDQLDLLSPDLDIGRYADVVVMMAAVHAPLEPAIAAALPSSAAALVGLNRRRKLPALRADLAALGRPFPSAVDLPPIEGPAAAVGALYVTEGATLGGALIAAHVAGVLGTATPLTFFRAYGADVPLRWSQFRAAAPALLTTGGEIETAAETADAVFATFARAAR
jgi:heme oxygenase